MVSESSRMLPFLSIGIAFALAILSILGYGPQIENVLALVIPVLTITAGGGLINKAIEAGVEKSKHLVDEGNLKALIDALRAQIEKEAEVKVELAKVEAEKLSDAQ